MFVQASYKNVLPPLGPREAIISNVLHMASGISSAINFNVSLHPYEDSWGWRRYVPSKRREISTHERSVTHQKTKILKFLASRATILQLPLLQTTHQPRREGALSGSTFGMWKCYDEIKCQVNQYNQFPVTILRICMAIATQQHIPYAMYNS